MGDIDSSVVLSTTVSTADNLDRMSGTHHTRYPLIGDGYEDFEGIVYGPAVIEWIEELQAGTIDFADIAAPLMTISADTNVSDAIDQFQAEGQELALILSEGAVVGLLTATDAFEAVMGQIEDQLDRENIA